ncbi:MAG: DUF2185 domain-containing protein [Myxococcales bacterium]|nr:DUF2185 domain-containing protein [Myxococcales bacterium]
MTHRDPERTGPVRLGTIHTPSGILATLDCGLMHLWCHDRPPQLPDGVLSSPEATANANNSADLQLTGPDAEACGLAYDRSHHPLFVFDIPGSHVDERIEGLRTFADEHGFDVQIEVVRPQLSHLQRAHDIIARQPGGSINFHGIWASVASGLPTDRELPVFADAHEGTEFAGRWQRVYVVARDAEIVRSEQAGWAMVDEARLMFCDLDRLGVWNDRETIDGKADLVFWDRDAASVAAEFAAPQLGEDNYGWRDRPVDEIVDLSHRIQAVRDAGEQKFALDFRPHTHHWIAMEQVRSGETESGVVDLDGAAATVFMTTWGDGIWEVHRDLDANGQVVRARVELATDQTVERMRAVNERFFGALSELALVTQRAWDHGIGFCCRDHTDREKDSGWWFSHGDESQEYVDDPENVLRVPLRDLVDRDESLEAIVKQPHGTAWHRKPGAAEFSQIQDWAAE